MKDRKVVQITRKGVSAEDICERGFSSFDWVSGEMEESERPKVLGLWNLEISSKRSLD